MPHNSRGHLLIVVFINGFPWNQKVEVWVVVGFTFIECSYKARVRIKGQWEVVVMIYPWISQPEYHCSPAKVKT